MARQHNKLNPLKVAKLNEVGKYADGLGLYLLIRRPATRLGASATCATGRLASLALGRSTVSA